MIVYVVSSGEYSDYAVRGVFSTMKNAQMYRDALSLNQEIEEYELDQMPKEIKNGLRSYRVRIRIETGDIIRVEQSQWEPSNNKWLAYWEPFNAADRPPLKERKYNALVIDCYAKDELHAAKIANERRALYLSSATGSESLLGTESE